MAVDTSHGIIAHMYDGFMAMKPFVETWGQFHRAACKQKICLSTKIARLFYTCYWQKFYGIYIAYMTGI